MSSVQVIAFSNSTVRVLQRSEIGDPWLQQWVENQQYRDLFTTAHSLYDDVIVVSPAPNLSDAIEGMG